MGKGRHHMMCGGPQQELARRRAEDARTELEAQMAKKLAAVESSRVEFGQDSSSRLSRKRQQSG